MGVKIFIGIIVSLAVLLGVGFAVRGLAKGAFKFGGPDGPAKVRVETIKPATLTEIVSAPGRIEPKTKVSISARVVSRIAELPFDEGAEVTAGGPTTKPSVLVRLDSKDLAARLRAVQARYEGKKADIEMTKARLASQESQIAASKADVLEAERDLNRQRMLYQSKDVSASVVEQAQSKYDGFVAQQAAAQHTLEADKASVSSMESGLKAAEAEVASAEEDLSYAVIESPIDGTVTIVNTEVGELVMTGTMNNPGTVLMEVADLRHMYLVARVDETSIAQVKIGQKARVRVQAYPDEVFEGVVETVALKETEEKDGSRFYKAEVLLTTNGRRILSGLNGDVEIQTQYHDNVLKIPSQAVLGRPVDALPVAMRNSPEVNKGKTIATVVYRYIGGKAVVTPVTVGPSDITHTIIRSGLSASDPVIVGPYKVLEALAHDQAVQDEAQSPATQPSEVAAR